MVGRGERVRQVHIAVQGQNWTSCTAGWEVSTICCMSAQVSECLSQIL